MHIYIGGDSFCSERSSMDHWPVMLSNSLGLKLQGKGFPGQGWWNTRKHLRSYLDSDLAAQTETFVLCHTNINRPLMTMTNGTKEFQEVAKIYHTYMEDDEISVWQASQWYLELNQWLEHKTVIHIPCFRYGQKLQDLLDGHCVIPALINFAQHGADWANHFTPEQNRSLANQLFRIITDPGSGLEISL